MSHFNNIYNNLYLHYIKIIILIMFRVLKVISKLKLHIYIYIYIYIYRLYILLCNIERITL